MNTKDMREALAAFRGCLKYLGSNANQETWICFALQRWGVDNEKPVQSAKNIVEQSIEPYGFYCTWARIRDRKDYTEGQFLAGRRKFVRACIAELQKRIRKARP